MSDNAEPRSDESPGDESRRDEARTDRPGPSGRDYAAADRLTLDTPERLKAVAEPIRLTIVDLVLERAMTVSELAERLGRPRGTVAHHVDVLVDAGLLKVVRTRKVRAIEERFYGRTATTYIFPDLPGEVPFARDMLAEIDLAKVERVEEFPSMFTLRHARIPVERAREFAERLNALALEYIELPRGGDQEYGLYLSFYPTNRLP